MAANILYVSDLSIMGGGEVCMAALIDRLDRGRFRPVAVVPGPGPLADLLVSRGVATRSVRLHREMRYWRVRRYWPPLARALARGRRDLARILDGEEIALVHTHGGMYTDNIRHLGTLARARRIPVVWDCGYGGTYRRDIVERNLAPWVDTVVAVSSSVRDMLVGQGWPRSVPIEVLHNALDLDTWTVEASRRDAVRAELGAGPGDILVGMVGRLIPIKGHDVFLEAARRLVPDHPRIRFTVVGEQSDDEGEGLVYSRGLRDAASREPLSGRLVMAGWRNDVPAVMHALDLLVQPSRGEAFGRTLIEAMYLERPVVATRVGGMPEIVVEGETGRLVPVDDAAALAAAIAALAGDDAARARMGRASRERVLARFELTRRTRAVEAIYASLL